jgi:23S rRNA (cytidine2498-2'-O)-methyltransferase
MDYYHQLKKSQLSFNVLVPFIKFDQELEKELLIKKIKIYVKTEKLFIIEPTDAQIIWAQDHWRDCHSALPTKELQQTLKDLNIFGYHYKTEKNKAVESLFGRLKHIPEKRIKFPVTKKFTFKYYIWTTYQDLVIYSLSPEKTYPAGWHEFEEDKEFPPNRAYLKLWEVFSTQDLKIKPTDCALEIGAAPGGWSWVLSQYFKKVYTIDRADLASQIKKINNITHVQGDAFKVSPDDFKDATWFFSDLICSPEKIHETIEFWLAHSRVTNFVCTIKFKGDTPFEVIEKLLKIPDSKVIRLYQNKNEVTWIKLGQNG